MVRSAGSVIPQVNKAFTRPESSNTESAPYRASVKGAGAVHDFLQYGFEIEAFGDAAADFAHSEEPRPQGF